MCPQAIASLLMTAIMLGVKATSLGAIIRTTNRKQELQMLVGELRRAGIVSSSMHLETSIPQELMERVRRATELAPPGMEIVRVLLQVAASRATECPSAH